MAEAEVTEEVVEEVVEDTPKPKKKTKVKEVIAVGGETNAVGPKTESMRTMPEATGRRMKTMADRNRL